MYLPIIHSDIFATLINVRACPFISNDSQVIYEGPKKQIEAHDGSVYPLIEDVCRDLTSVLVCKQSIYFSRSYKSIREFLTNLPINQDYRPGQVPFCLLDTEWCHGVPPCLYINKTEN